MGVQRTLGIMRVWLPPAQSSPHNKNYDLPGAFWAFFFISAVCRVLRGASLHEIQVQASCIHLESSVWRAEGRIEMHFECEFGFEMMIEFFIASLCAKHCKCRNQMARCCWQHLQTVHTRTGSWGWHEEGSQPWLGAEKGFMPLHGPSDSCLWGRGSSFSSTVHPTTSCSTEFSLHSAWHR